MFHVEHSLSSVPTGTQLWIRMAIATCNPIYFNTMIPAELLHQNTSLPLRIVSLYSENISRFSTT